MDCQNKKRNSIDSLNISVTYAKTTDADDRIQKAMALLLRNSDHDKSIHPTDIDEKLEDNELAPGRQD